MRDSDLSFIKRPRQRFFPFREGPAWSPVPDPEFHFDKGPSSSVECRNLAPRELR